MDDKVDPIPEQMTIREASEFWDSHSVADYPSHVIEMAYAPDDQIAVMAIAAELFTTVHFSSARQEQEHEGQTGFPAPH